MQATPNRSEPFTGSEFLTGGRVSLMQVLCDETQGASSAGRKFGVQNTPSHTGKREYGA